MKADMEARDSEDAEPFLDVRGMAVAIWRRLWIIALVTVLGGGGAYLYVRDRPILYLSTETIEIEPQKNPQLSALAGGDEDLKNPEVIETIIRSFRHRALMESVCDKLNLTSDERFLRFTPPAPVDRTIVIETLLNQSGARLQRGTRLVDITFAHEDPVVAQKIVSVLVEQFREQDVNQRFKAVEEQNEMWKEKKEILEGKLKDSEAKRQRYKDAAGSASVEDEYNLADEKLRNLNSEWNTLRSEILQMEANADSIRKAGSDPALLMNIPIIAQDQEVVRAKERLTEQENELASLAQRYRDKYPAMIEAKAQLSNARDAMNRVIVGTPSRLATKAKTAEVRAQSLEAAVGKQEKTLLEVDKRMAEFRKLQHEFESDQALFHAVLQREKESTAALSTNFARFNVVEPAVSATPLRNRRLLLVLCVALGSGGLVTGVVLALFLLATSIRTVDEAERVLGFPVLAAVPTLTKKAGAAVEGMPNSQGAVAESFRTLRTALSLSRGSQGPPRVIYFTSAASGEGKSFSASQTALAFARQGLRTVLIDCDLRCPAIHPLFLEGEHSPPGVADYLSRQPSTAYQTSTENLWVFPAGSPAGNPAELLSGPRFAKMIAAIKEAFDRVIVDTAPLNIVSDTLSTISFSDAICLVVRCNVTPRKAVHRSIELLRRAGVKPQGIVLNGVPTSKVFSDYYHYSSDQTSTAHLYGSNGGGRADRMITGQAGEDRLQEVSGGDNREVT